ncbi:MAG: pro-sigmaK processing inhibitor BofA family protein [Ignavibacteriales bacterium]
MEIIWWIAAVFLLVVGLVICRRWISPRWLIRQVLVRTGLGLVLLLAVNAVGNYLAISLPVNFATVGIAGLLGAPGVAIVAYVCYIIT